MGANRCAIPLLCSFLAIPLFLQYLCVWLFLQSTIPYAECPDDGTAPPHHLVGWSSSHITLINNQSGVYRVALPVHAIQRRKLRSVTQHHSTLELSEGCNRVVQLTTASTLAITLKVFAVDRFKSVQHAAHDPLDQLDMDALIQYVLEVFVSVECVMLRKDILLGIPAMMKVHVDRTKKAHKQGHAASVWRGLPRVLEAIPVLKQLVGADMMLRPTVVDIAEQVMLLSCDHDMNATIAVPFIVEAFTTAQGRGQNSHALRQSTLSLWRAMTSVAPPVQHFANVFRIGMELLIPESTCLTSIEMPCILEIVLDMFVLGGAEVARQHGAQLILALVAVAHNDQEATIAHRWAVGRAIVLISSLLPAQEGAQLLCPLYEALLVRPDGTVCSFWENGSFKHKLMEGLTRLAYQDFDVLLPLIAHLGSLPGAPATNHELLQTFFHTMPRTFTVTIRLMAAVVCSGLMLRMPSEVQLQPFVKEIVTASVELITAEAITPIALKRGLQHATNGSACAEREQKLLLGNLEAHARVCGCCWTRGIEAMVARLATLKPSVATDIRALAVAFTPPTSPIDARNNVHLPQLIVEVHNLHFLYHLRLCHLLYLAHLQVLR